MGYRVIRDPVYGYVQLPEELDQVVDSPIVQRLRRVSQTSLTSAVYPSATGTRFEHALGTMFLAGRAWTAAWQNASEAARRSFETKFLGEVSELATQRDSEVTPFPEAIRLTVMAVGLLHDVGHPPFSHVLEPVYEAHLETVLGEDNEELLRRIHHRNDQLHESFGELLLETYLLPRMSAWLAPSVRAVYIADPAGASAVSSVHSIVSGELDVDRLDYLMRDSQRAGTEYGALDWERLVDAFRLRVDDDDKPRMLPTMRARSAAESLLVQRVQAYRWIIYHHQVVGANLALANALDLLMILCENKGSQQFDVRGALLTVSDALRPCLPNLNYLRPGRQAARTVAGLPERGNTLGGASETPGPGDVEVLVQSMVAALDQREVVGAAVDDSTVTTCLMRARTVAAAMAPEVSGNTAHTLRLLVAFVDAALLRRKNYIAIWRSESEFAASARLIWEQHGLGAETEQRLASLGQARTAPIDASYFEQLGVAAKVNLLIANVLAEPDARTELQELLADALGQQSSAPGEWRVTPIKFSAVAAGTKAGRLWDDNGRPFVLSERSELVRALERVDQQRPKIGFYYFLTDATAHDQRELRMALRGLALGVVTTVVSDYVAARLNIIFPDPPEDPPNNPPDEGD